MTFNKDGEVPKRFYRGKSLRLPKHNYSWTRAYFVTGWAITRDPIFEIPVLHTILQEPWDALPIRFPGVTLDAFVIMPDHIHGLLWLDGLVATRQLWAGSLGPINPSPPWPGLTTANQSVSTAVAPSGSVVFTNGSCATTTRSPSTAVTSGKTPKNWNDANTNCILNISTSSQRRNPCAPFPP